MPVSGSESSEDQASGSALDRLQTIANTADRTVSIWPAAAASRQWRRASHICLLFGTLILGGALTTHTCSGDLRSSPSHHPCLARDSSLPRTPEPRQRYRAPEYDMPPLRIGVHASIAAGPLRLVEMAVRGVASPSARAALQRRAPRARLQQLSIRPYIQVVSRSMWKRYRDGSSGCLRQSHSFSVGVLYWSAYRSPRTRVVRQRRHRGRGTSSLTQRLA